MTRDEASEHEDSEFQAEHTAYAKGWKLERAEELREQSPSTAGVKDAGGGVTTSEAPENGQGPLRGDCVPCQCLSQEAE